MQISGELSEKNPTLAYAASSFQHLSSFLSNRVLLYKYRSYSYVTKHRTESNTTGSLRAIYLDSILRFILPILDVSSYLPCVRCEDQQHLSLLSSALQMVFSVFCSMNLLVEY